MPLIKRYSNRKLYEPENRRYVTLEEIADMVRQDIEVKVVDHETGADLTSATLMQIVFDEEKRIGGILPEVMLRRLIRAGGATLSGLRESARAFIEPEQHIDRGIQGRLDRLVSLNLITADQGIQLENLLLDPELSKPVGYSLEDQADPERIEELLEEIQRLENAVKELEEGESMPGFHPGEDDSQRI